MHYRHWKTSDVPSCCRICSWPMPFLFTHSFAVWLLSLLLIPVMHLSEWNLVGVDWPWTPGQVSKGSMDWPSDVKWWRPAGWVAICLQVCACWGAGRDAPCTTNCPPATTFFSDPNISQPPDFQSKNLSKIFATYMRVYTVCYLECSRNLTFIAQ